MQKIYDLVGVGLGPFNLSIAALASTKPEISSLFLERKSAFSWHPGLLLNEAKMQTSYLKDLVTCVDPTNPHSFLNYLVMNNKLYPFIASGQSVISRLEFSDYLAWAAASVGNTQFNSAVERIDYRDELFEIQTQTTLIRAKNVVMGTGTQPTIPDFCQPFLSDTCFHASELALRQPDLTGKRVAIIGGGQTGADVFQHLFDGEFKQVASLNWISRRANLEALDESCFTDQYFMPDYVNGFYHLDQQVKQQEVSKQKLTSDGITNDCLQGIYQRLYHDKFVLNRKRWWQIQPHCTFTGLTQTTQGYALNLQHGLTKHRAVAQADVIILCTGFQRALPACLAPIAPLLDTHPSGLPMLCPDFSVKWQKDTSNRLYMVNAGLESHGIAEPQLSLATWRAAKILNHVAGQTLYPLNEQQMMIDWGIAVTET